MSAVIKETSAVVKETQNMTLAARCAEFQRIISAVEVTDRGGARRETEKALVELVALLTDLRLRGGHLYLIGNGGSAGVAAHAVTDFLNVAKLKATTLHDPSLLTCMANDYGYENAFSRILETVGAPGDVLIAISSSGNSNNIRNAVVEMRKLRGTAITLSGFKRGNPLRSLGDVNLYLDSADYGMVEIGHQFLLHNLADRLRLGM